MESTGQQKVIPTQEKNRVVYLDILRGIAILFIYIANIQAFSGDYYFSDEVLKSFPSYKIDALVYHAIVLLVDAKFYSIFSILFGIGFAIQFNNLTKKNKPFSAFFCRRMFGLFCIGLIHLFIWLGDILVLYSLVGFVLILFRNQSDKNILRWVVALLFLPIAHQFFMAATGWFYAWPIFGAFFIYAKSIGLPEMGFNQMMLYYLETESVSEYFKISLGLPLVRWASILNQGRLFKVLAMFLLGLWIGRRIMHAKLLENVAFLKKVALWGFAIGIPGNILRVFAEELADGNFWDYLKLLSFPLGVVPLACAYAATVALWLRKKPNALHWFAPVGRMALTNYVAQTIIAITLFYGIGFGLAGQFGLTYAVWVSIVVFIAQIYGSKWWLSQFTYGPLEWLWRKMTYKKMP